jgi:hypothetical protein
MGNLNPLVLGNWLLIPQYPGAIKKLVQLVASTVYQHGMILGQVTSRPRVYGPYDPAATDGRQQARLILEADCVTDAQGIITVAATTPGTGYASNEPTDRVYAFESGAFATADLVGLDAQAVSQLGRLIQGTVTQGILMLE